MEREKIMNKLYKNNNNEIFDLSPLDIENNRQIGLIELTDEEVYLHLSPIKAEEQILAEAKIIKEFNLATITVATKAGNTFDGNDKAINRMMAAIQASAVTGITETKWVLADNSNVMVTLDELIEALVLSIQAIGIEVTE